MATQLNSKDKFLDDVCKHVHSNYDHKRIKMELSQHIDDLCDELDLDIAIECMGDPTDIGTAMNDIYKPWVTRFWLATRRINIVMIVILIMTVVWQIDSKILDKPNFRFSGDVDYAETVYETNTLWFDGNRYNFIVVYDKPDFLEAHILIDSNEYSAPSQVSLSNLIINGVSYDFDHMNPGGNETVITLNTYNKISHLEDISIQVNGQVLYAKLKGGPSS